MSTEGLLQAQKQQVYITVYRGHALLMSVLRGEYGNILDGKGYVAVSTTSK